MLDVSTTSNGELTIMWAPSILRALDRRVHVGGVDLFIGYVIGIVMILAVAVLAALIVMGALDVGSSGHTVTPAGVRALGA